METEIRDTDSEVHPKAVEREMLAIRRRRMGTYGLVLFIVGLCAALVAMWALESLMFATLWIVVALVGGGFLAVGDLKLADIIEAWGNR